MTDTVKLEPCALCGCPDIATRNQVATPFWTATCEGCGLELRSKDGWAYLVAAWNRRATRPADAVRVAAMEDALKKISMWECKEMYEKLALTPVIILAREALAPSPGKVD